MAYEQEFTEKFYKTNKKIDFKGKRKARLRKNAFIKSMLTEEGLNKLGEYDEDVGGGTPADDNERGRGSMGQKFVVADSPEDPLAKEAKKAGKRVRYKQPRKANGQFGHNSDNLRGLHSEARGKTDTQTSKYIRDEVGEGIEEGQVLKEKTDKGDKYYYSTISMSKEELKSKLQSYIEQEGNFEGLGDYTTIEKKGKPSKAEKESAEGIVQGKKLDLSKAAKSTVDTFNKYKEMYKEQNPSHINYAKKVVTPSQTNNQQAKSPQTNMNKPVQNQTQQPKSEASTASKLLKEDVGSNSSDVQFNADEIGSTPQEAKAWVMKNKDAIKKIQEKNPKATIGGIVNAIKNGKIKKLSDVLGGE